MTTLPPEGEANTPQQPPAAPQQPPVAPPAGYQAPPPGYQAPPPGYQAPPPGYQTPPADPGSTLQTNYWLSVFFALIPALIYYLVNKDKGDQRLRALDAANLNFVLLRIICYIAGFILVVIPILGWILSIAINITGFVLHIIAATKVKNAYGNGSDPFLLNLPMVK